jgi:S-DNA-T family DNA segregation ATPase FtsK/SpoIIIE
MIHIGRIVGKRWQCALFVLIGEKNMTLFDGLRRGTHYSDRMNRILGVIADHGLLYHDTPDGQRITDITAGDIENTPTAERYALDVPPRLLPRVRAMRQQFAYVLNVPRAEVEIDGGRLFVRVPKPQGERDIVDFESCYTMRKIKRGAVLLGMDDEGAQLCLDFTKPENTHAACVGMTGSGKSYLMRAMALSALMGKGLRVALFDPIGDFELLGGHPLVWRGGAFRTPDEIELGLEALTAQINRGKGEAVLVILDELPDLIMQRPAIKDHVQRLAQAGRHAGVHLVIGAQHPLNADLGPTTMRNIPCRLVGKVADATAAYNAAGRRDSGAEKLGGRGDFVYINGDVRTHFRAAFVDDALLRDWAERYPLREPRIPVRAARKAAQNTEGIFLPDGGSPGRPQDDIPPEVVEGLQDYNAVNGEWPSLRAIYRMTLDLYGEGFGRDKAKRALALAKGER